LEIRLPPRNEEVLVQPPSDEFASGHVPSHGPCSLTAAVGITLLVINFGVAALMLVFINLG
jgi:hypothetical protein